MRKFSELFNHNRIHHVSDFSSLPSSSVTYLYDPTNIGFGSVVGTPDAYTLMPSAGADILAYAYSQQQVSGSFTTNASITIGDSISPSVCYFGLISEDNATPTFLYDLFFGGPSASLPDLIIVATRTNSGLQGNLLSNTHTSESYSVPTSVPSAPGQIIEFYIDDSGANYELWIRIAGEGADILLSSVPKTVAPNGVRMFVMAGWSAARTQGQIFTFGVSGITPVLDTNIKGKSYRLTGPDYIINGNVTVKQGDLMVVPDLGDPFLIRDHTANASAADMITAQNDIGTLSATLNPLVPRVDTVETTTTVLEASVSNLQISVGGLIKGPVGKRKLGQSVLGTPDVTVDSNTGANYANFGSPYVLDLATLFQTTSEVLVDITNISYLGSPHGGDNGSVVIQVGLPSPDNFTLQEGLVTFYSSDAGFMSYLGGYHQAFNLYVVSPNAQILFHRHYHVNSFNASYQVGAKGFCTLRIGSYNGGITFGGLDSANFKVKEVVYECIPSHCVYKWPTPIPIDVVTFSGTVDYAVNVHYYKKANRLYFRITQSAPGPYVFNPAIFFSDYFTTDLFIEVDSSKITTYNGQAIAADTVFHYTSAITTDFFENNVNYLTPTFVLQNKFTL